MKILSIFCLLLISQATIGQKNIEKPNIIWISIEDLSSHYLPMYGNTIAKTPNLDKLAAESVRFTNAHTVAGVCAPSRSSIITGMYPTSIGTHNMATLSWRQQTGQPPRESGDALPVYSCVIPEQVKCFTEYLRADGYYCSNNEKQDYQFLPPVTAWDESSAAASYRNRPNDKPFFAVFNFGITHESQLIVRKDSSITVDEDKIVVPPIYPNTKIVKNDIARILTNVEIVDKQIGDLIQQLKDDGVYENTYIFFFSDHGGMLPWSKREITDRGTKIALTVKHPKSKYGGTINNDLISAIDFTPTILSLANIKPLKHLQGQAFLGKYKAPNERKFVYGARDRMDEKYDRQRMVRTKEFLYLYNYKPELPYYQDLGSRKRIPTMQEILKLKAAGKLDSVQASWFNTKPIEEFYKLENDPYQLHNLINDPRYKNEIAKYREAFKKWTKKYGDKGSIEERALLKQMWNGGDKPPLTEKATVELAKDGVRLKCNTKGASIGYKILKEGESNKPLHRIVYSWCMFTTVGFSKNGQEIFVPSPYNVYKGETIALKGGEKLIVNTQRIGYEASEITYSLPK